MTRQDFLLILVEAMAHEPIDAFFRAKQKQWRREGYSKRDFQQGLLFAFKWLYFEACRPDPFKYELKKPGGEVTIGYLFTDYEERREALKKEGELTFPFTKTIYVRKAMDKRPVWQFDVNMLNDLWLHLFVFLNPNFDPLEVIPPPPLSSPYEPGGEYDNSILVPDSIAVLFKYTTLQIENDSGQNHPLALPGQMQDTTNHTGRGQDQPGFKSNIKKTLSINQFALIQAYEGQIITRDNCDEKVKECGKTSGEKLYQRFLFYSSAADRRARPRTDKALRFKIKLFESIYDLLTKKAKVQALLDIEKLLSYGESED
jgi:hypothetical protein